MNKQKPWKIPLEATANLGHRIREARERAGYKTPGELSRAIKKSGSYISPQYIRVIEIGEQTPSMRKVTRILDACGLTVRDFFGTDLPEEKDASVLGMRLRKVREAAGYETSSQLWKAIRDRGDKIDRQYLYRLEWGKQTTSLNKLKVILDACNANIFHFLGKDLTVEMRGDSNVEERKLIRMLRTIRAADPSLARILEFMISTAFKEVSEAALHEKC